MSSPDLVARLVDVGKEYVKYEDTPTLLTGILRRPGKGRRGRLWAVRHLDLEVMRGESVGVLGRNGAGKSTTLAMLAGVTAPSEGSVMVRGRLAPLLQLGVGFHQELTGRENVYVNGTVLGMSRAEIDRAFDSIVEFAELERFVDTPVKFYSSGMLVRLGFASAVAATPDLLLIDEVLSVGDIAFQRKSFARMQEMREGGTTLVVVSHNIEAIRTMCVRCVVMNAGTPVFNGRTNDAISVYHSLIDEAREEEEQGRTDGPLRVLSFDIINDAGEMTADVEAERDVVFRMRTRFDARVTDPAFGFWVATAAGQMVYADNTFGNATGTFEAGAEITTEVRLRLSLTTGNYVAGGSVRWGRENFELARVPQKSFSVVGRTSVYGIADLHARFVVDGTDLGHTGGVAAQTPRADASEVAE